MERGESSGLSEAEKAAVRMAETMTRDARAVDDELFSELRRHFDEGQLVELAAVIGLFNYFNRFNDFFQMELTPPGDR